jgi:hypothetical protein
MTASTWEQLTEQLAARLPQLDNDDVINLKSEGRYTQLIQVEDGLILEAVSNRFLPPDSQLTPHQEEQLQQKGWEPPNPPLRLNWWHDVKQWPLHSRDADRIADLMISTLRDVYRIADPGDVVERTFNTTK